MKIWIVPVLLMVSLTSSAFAACDECNVTPSCETYQECMAGKLECLAACNQKEAAKISAEESMNEIEIQKQIIETLKETFIIAQKTAELLEKVAREIELSRQKQANSP